MSPQQFLARFVSLPEMQLLSVDGRTRPGWLLLTFQSTSQFRACPKCATLSYCTYDHRLVKVLDSPLRDRKVQLKIRKKRYYCPRCRKPFTELLHGIFQRSRLTER